MGREELERGESRVREWGERERGEKVVKWGERGEREGRERDG